jgi:RHS repeat-associated protein
VGFGFRDFDQASGRWMARDPVLYDGGQANLFVYLGNDPVGLRDPLGLWCFGGSVCLGFGSGVVH